MHKHSEDETNHESIDFGTNWTPLYFFMFIVITEHCLLVLKIVVEQLIDDVPGDIQKGEQERRAYIEKFNEDSERMKKSGDISDFECVK